MARRQWRLGLCSGLWGIFGSIGVALAATAGVNALQTARYWVFIGTYTQRHSQGIYRCEWDIRTGSLSEPQLAAKATHPSFLAIHPRGKYLYAVGELEEFAGKKTGVVNAFSIDLRTGQLELLDQKPSGGAGPCHLVVDRTGSCILVANYGGGSVACLRIQADGRLQGPTTVIAHKGKGANPRRQEAPHAHAIQLDGTNRLALAADLGLDRVLIYRFFPDEARLQPHEPAYASVAAGSGPRHLAFHPHRPYVYVVNELSNTVTAFHWDAERGRLSEIQTISTLPADFRGTSYAAEVAVHPSGRFLYASNRGYHSIALFSIADDGRLTAAGYQSEGIDTPRHFAIDPTGRYMLVGNQAADNVCVFSIDARTGALTPTGVRVGVPVPVCLQFLAVPAVQ
ncbi:MAG: 6-phosphogluconolactonase [Gemmataceae bacterium]